MKMLVLSAVALCLFAGGAAAQDKKKPAAGAATAAGKVKAIDEKAATITLEGKKAKDGTAGPDQTFALAKDAKVTEGKEAKTLADVKVGATVTLTLTEDKKSATAVALPAKGKEKGK